MRIQTFAPWPATVSLPTTTALPLASTATPAAKSSRFHAPQTGGAHTAPRGGLYWPPPPLAPGPAPVARPAATTLFDASVSTAKTESEPFAAPL